MSITRRDFLNGAALTIAAGLTPAAQLAAQPGALSAGADRAARPACGIVRGCARAGARGPALCRRQRRDRRELRSRGGGRRHQRACGGVVLPPRAAVGAHSHSRQSRRLRRPRQAQRVHARRPPPHRLWRQPVAAVAEFAVQSGRQELPPRSRHRHQDIRDRVRARALSVARAVARDILQPRGVRPRRAGDRRACARQRR